MSASDAPAVKLPSFDTTLGALYIGYSLGLVLYGVTCVQTFVYTTSKRSARDGRALKTFVYLLLLLDTAQTILSMMGLYKIFVSSFATFLLPSPTGQNAFLSGIQMLDEEGAFGIIVIVLVQLFFARRVWAMASHARYPLILRYSITAVIVLLSLFTFGINIVVTVKGLQKRKTATLFQSDPSFTLWWKLSFSGAVACDVIISCAMVIILRRARTGVARTDHVLNMIILFAVNTGLATTLMTIAALVQYLVVPSAIYYVGVAIFIPKSYCNSALAALNSRDFLREKLAEPELLSSYPIPDFSKSTLDLTRSREESPRHGWALKALHPPKIEEGRSPSPILFTHSHSGQGSTQLGSYPYAY